MQMFAALSRVYLHREPVDFRKSINGLSVIVEEEMALPLFGDSLFVFCNRKRDKLKILYWDNTGFCLWYKRLEKEKLKWPKKAPETTLKLTEEQFHWLLKGYDFSRIKSHKSLAFTSVN